MVVDIKLDGNDSISIPESLYTPFCGTCFIDGIALPSTSEFSSAVVVGGPYSYCGMGVIANHNKGDIWAANYEVHTPPIGSDWPQQGAVQAVCGVSGGMVAFATIDGGVPFIQVNNSPVSAAGGWSIVKTLPFAQNFGTVQAMLEQDGAIYGFIKARSGSDNYYFVANIQGSELEYVQVWSYSGPTAASFYPPVPNIAANWLMPRRVALYNGHLYALDESRANVISITLDGYSHASSPLADANTGGLLMDPKSQKAYCLYTTGDDVDVRSYTVSGTTFTPGPSIGSGTCVCPSLDGRLGLLYLIGATSGNNAVFDIKTDTQVLLAGGLADAAPLKAQSSTWVDAVNPILYVSGYLDEHNSPSIVMPYRVTILPKD